MKRNRDNRSSEFVSNSIQGNVVYNHLPQADQKRRKFNIRVQPHPQQIQPHQHQSHQQTAQQGNANLAYSNNRDVLTNPGSRVLLPSAINNTDLNAFSGLQTGSRNPYLVKSEDPLDASMNRQLEWLYGNMSLLKSDYVGMLMEEDAHNGPNTKNAYEPALQNQDLRNSLLPTVKIPSVPSGNRTAGSFQLQQESLSARTHTHSSHTSHKHSNLYKGNANGLRPSYITPNVLSSDMYKASKQNFKYGKKQFFSVEDLVPIIPNHLKLDPKQLSIDDAAHLGKGGYGTVTEGWYMGLRVAVKTTLNETLHTETNVKTRLARSPSKAVPRPSPEYIDSSSSQESDVDPLFGHDLIKERPYNGLEYILYEILNASQASSHPNIVSILGYVDLASRMNQLYIVYEYMNLGPLHQYIKDSLSESKVDDPIYLLHVTNIVYQIATGLRFMHDQLGLYHMDLHMANVLLKSSPRIIQSRTGVPFSAVTPQRLRNIPVAKVSDLGMSQKYIVYNKEDTPYVDSVYSLDIGTYVKGISNNPEPELSLDFLRAHDIASIGSIMLRLIYLVPSDPSLSLRYKRILTLIRFKVPSGVVVPDFKAIRQTVDEIAQPKDKYTDVAILLHQGSSSLKFTVKQVQVLLDIVHRSIMEPNDLLIVDKYMVKSD